ncbi:hypothetical protein [Geobacter sp. SVR]|uniref:hypothetical protein n=1 Tax=Geobacter sp. SVR TaxID=2495594 RepID=UPI00143F0481|nr:hypothetical protein [Geobacter sp. SVR]BCS53304.1 hypothetical protein GSVR_16120 [Geobacter sp. SVR]GCF85570.1 hypothetical protein GSbR_21700 [Geobacter sp. SVR]
MAEFVKPQPSSRKQADPRDFFSFTTPNLKIQARPTDPYKRPEVSPDVASFVDALKNVDKITNGFIQIQKAYKDENALQGKADAIAGKPYQEPEGFLNNGYGYREAYDVTQGEAKGLEFRKEYLLKLKENNYFQNQPDPQGAHDKFFQDLYTHHFSAVGNNPTIMFGASEQLKQAQVEGSMEFQKASYDTAKTSFTNSISQMQQDHLYTYAKGAKTEEDIANLRRLMGDDWALKVKPTNFVTRDEYSRMVVANIGATAMKIAQDQTIPASEALTQAHKLLSLYDAPDPDTKQSWSTMVDAEGKLKFRPDIEHIQSRITHIQTEREKADAKWLKQKQDNEEKDLFVNVVLNPDLLYSQAQAAITGAKYLDANNTQSLVAKLYEYRNGEKNIIQDWPHITNIRERVEMSTSVSNLDALRKEVITGYGSRMNHETAKDLQERITSRINHIQSEARANRTLTVEERKLGWDMLKQVVGEKSMYDLDGTQAAMRMDTYGRMFFGRVNAGETPQQVASDLISKYGKDTGRTAAEIFGPSKYTSAEAIKADVESGKLRPDEGVLELRRFLSGKQIK